MQQRPRLVVGSPPRPTTWPATRGKLERKGVDLVCANRSGATGFESDDNALLVLGHDGFEVRPRPRRENPNAGGPVAGPGRGAIGR